MRFLPFYGFNYDFLESSKMFTILKIKQDLKLKHEKSRVCKGSCFWIFAYLSCKTGRIDFSEKRDPAQIKYLLPVHQILRDFTEENARKLVGNFTFCAHVDIIKYRKH